MNDNMTITKVNAQKPKKMRVLFESWFNIPHSYAICNCFQLVHLIKNFSDQIEFYMLEAPYFNPMWYNNKKLVYPKEYNDIISNIKVYNGEPVDLIYRQTYPYNISVSNENEHVPKCVFYTSEFATLDTNYFKVDNLSIDLVDDFVKEYLKKYSNIYFMAPSMWSAKGMKKYLPLQQESKRNRVVTHGVDTHIFKKDTSRRKETREKYNIKETDIVFINIGSMTRNKGIVLILQTLHLLVNKLNRKEYKLILKGTSDLYQSKLFLEFYFGEMQDKGVITSIEVQNLTTHHIIFMDKTLSYAGINHLFNACDLYISPYHCEGFGLTMLEAISAGLNVLVPITGSTKEYMQDIYNNGGQDYITYISSYVQNIAGRCENVIDVHTLVQTILRANFHAPKSDNTYKKMHNYIENNYSWNAVSKMVFDYFKFILQNESL